MKTSNHSHSSTRTRLRSRGFTLVEIMVVIAIILVLASFTIGGMGWYKRKAAIGKTTVLMGSIERALEDYAFDHSVYPVGNGDDDSTKDVYMALFGDADTDGVPDDGATVYLQVLDPKLTGKKKNVDSSNYTILDAWGETFKYQSPGDMNPQDDFDLWSLGPDGEGGPNQGTKKERADDIKNW